MSPTENTNYSTLNSLPPTISFHPQLPSSHTRRNRAISSRLCKSEFSPQLQRSLPCFPGRGEVKRGRLEPPQALGGKTPAEQSNAITLRFSYFKRQFLYGDKNNWFSVKAVNNVIRNVPGSLQDNMRGKQKSCF